MCIVLDNQVRMCTILIVSTYKQWVLNVIVILFKAKSTYC